ncbi:TPA: hypothetical protein R1R37_002556 [Klebsiella aerogenes]|nr:hypothetical protein [Klebsiella aerogenes]MBE0013901.1 hypothetical protein [Raoultella planticola]MBG1888411.1 hypothetical protein [Klebsiella aerogenes]MBQ0676716.1 hypothetical protein [Klebsiella aerogenes]HBZ8437669.1 hypothetical protein [Klebsiella aerogenes]
MQNIKIEYINGALVALERDGVSYAHLPVSAIHFDHTAKIFPHLKIEIEAGGAPFVPAVPAQPQPAEPEQPPAAVEEVQPAKEGELLLPGDTAPRPARRPRHRNRNRNRSQ